MKNRDRTSLESEAHLWHVRLTGMGSSRLLSEDERARAGRFTFDQDRERFVSCRCELRQTLSGYLNVPAGSLRFAYGPHGKPFLPDADLRFNVSHCGDHALIAVTQGRDVGVDIECHGARLNVADLTRHFLTPAEAAFVHSAPADEQLDAFLACWTRKEAWAKAVGVGLAEPLDRFDVGASLGIPVRTLHDRVTGRPWTIVSVDLGHDLRAALVAEGVDGRVRRMSPSASDPCL